MESLKRIEIKNKIYLRKYKKWQVDFLFVPKKVNDTYLWEME